MNRTIKINLGRCHKSHPIRLLEVKTSDYKLLVMDEAVGYDVDPESRILKGTLTVIDVYGNNISFPTSKLIHIIPFCGTLIKRKKEIYWIAHPPKMINNQSHVTVLKNTESETEWGACYRYDNMFSL